MSSAWRTLKNTESANRALLLFRGHAVTFGAPTPVRLGYVGESYPPADTMELAGYRDMFHICGWCNLRRYGSSADGGYLLCSLEGMEAETRYAAVYSYGIDG